MPKKYVLGEQWKKLNYEKDKMIPLWKNLQANMQHVMIDQYGNNLVSIFRAYQGSPDDPRFTELKKHMHEGYDQIWNYSDEDLKAEVRKVLSSKHPTWPNGFWNALGQLTTNEYPNLGLDTDLNVMKATVYDEGLREINNFLSVLEDVEHEGKVLIPAFVKDEATGKMVLNEDNKPELDRKSKGFENLLNGDTDEHIFSDPKFDDLRSMLDLPHDQFVGAYELNKLKLDEVVQALVAYEMESANPGKFERPEKQITKETYDGYMHFLIAPNGVGVPLEPYQVDRLTKVQQLMQEKRASMNLPEGANPPDHYVRLSDMTELMQSTEFVRNFISEDDPQYQTFRALSDELVTMCINAISSPDAHVNSQALLAGVPEQEKKLVSLNKLDEVALQQNQLGDKLPSVLIRQANLFCKDFLSRTSAESEPVKYTFLKNLESLTEGALSGLDPLEIEYGAAASGRAATASLNDVSGPSDERMNGKTAEERLQLMRSLERGGGIFHPVFAKIQAGLEQKKIITEYYTKKKEFLNANNAKKKFDEAKYEKALRENANQILKDIDEVAELIDDPKFDATKLPFYTDPDKAMQNFKESRGLAAMKYSATKTLALLDSGEPLDHLPIGMASPKVVSIYGNDADYPERKDVNLPKLRGKSPLLDGYLSDLQLLNMTTTTEGLQELNQLAKRYATSYSALVREAAERVADFQRGYNNDANAYLKVELTKEEKALLDKCVADGASVDAYLSNASFGKQENRDVQHAKHVMDDLPHILFENRFLSGTDTLFTEEQRKQMVESSTGRKNSTLYQEMQDAYLEVEKMRTAILNNEPNHPTPKGYRDAVQKLHDKAEAYETGRSGLLYANSTVGANRKKQSTLIKEQTAKLLDRLDRSIDEMTVEQRQNGMTNLQIEKLRAAASSPRFKGNSYYGASNHFDDYKKDLKAVEDPYYRLRERYGAKGKQAKFLGNKEQYDKIELPIPGDRDDDFSLAIMLGACMDPKRLRGGLSSSSAGQRDLEGLLELNQLFFVDNLLENDERGKGFGPITLAARKEAKSALEEYNNGHPEKVQKYYAHFFEFACKAVASEEFDGLSGKIAHPAKQAIRLVVKFMDDPTLSANVSMTEVDRVRLHNFERVCRLEEENTKLVGNIFQEPSLAPVAGSKDRQEMAERYIFNKMVKNALYGIAKKNGDKAQTDIILNHMKDTYDLTVTEGSRTLGTTFYEDGDADHGLNRKIQSAYMHHQITSMEILLLEDARLDELRAQYSDAIKNSPAYARLVHDEGADLQHAIEEANALTFESFDQVQPDMTMAKAAADAINANEKKAFDDDMEKANFGVKATTDMAWNQFLSFRNPTALSKMKEIPNSTGEGMEALRDNLKMIADFLDHPDPDNKNASPEEYFQDMKSVRDARAKLENLINKVDAYTYNVEHDIGAERKAEWEADLKAVELALEKASEKNANPIVEDEENEYVGGVDLSIAKGMVAANRSMIHTAYETTDYASTFGRKLYDQKCEVVNDLREKADAAHQELAEMDKHQDQYSQDQKVMAAARYLFFDSMYKKYDTGKISLKHLDEIKELTSEQRIEESVEQIAGSKELQMAVLGGRKGLVNIKEDYIKELNKTAKEKQQEKLQQKNLQQQANQQPQKAGPVGQQ